MRTPDTQDDGHSELDVDPATDPAYAGHVSGAAPSIIDGRSLGKKLHDHLCALAQDLTTKANP